MDSMDPTNAQFAAYRAMWLYFNTALFNGALPPVILNFSRHANSLGFFAPLRWERGKQTTHEISLNPSYLKRRPARDVASTLVHEMAHLALPDTGEAHAWLSEGLATYVEGVARVQAGNRSEADVWAEEMRQMPRGLPESGDRGLDRTHTWARTYWGGAMFCLLADVDIHRQSHNRFGLQDALRAIVRDSGGLAADWPIERVLLTGDHAVGTTTLEDLYARLKDSPVTPDLMGLWRELGIESEDSSVRLSDSAPLADVRRAIMRAR